MRPEEKIKALRAIVEQKQYGKIEGSTVDLFSASAIVQIYDALGEEAQAKYLSMPVVTMADMAFKLIERCKK